MNKQDFWSKAALPLIALALAASPSIKAHAQTAPQTAQAVTAKDKAWMDKAAQGGAAEVQAGKLAAGKGSTPAVQNFGQQMMTDHGKAGDELKAIAGRKGISLPDGPDKKGQDLIAKLDKLSGAKFDKEYTKAMVKEHKETETHFKGGAKKLSDADVKAFAAKTLPTIQHHLEMAKALK